MKRHRLVVLVGLVVIGVAASAVAQEDKDQGKDKMANAAVSARWSGVIVRMNKDTSTGTVRNGHIEKIIHFDGSTKWTKGTQRCRPGPVHRWLSGHLPGQVQRKEGVRSNAHRLA